MLILLLRYRIISGKKKLFSFLEYTYIIYTYKIYLMLYYSVRDNNNKIIRELINFFFSERLKSLSF